MFTPLIVSVQHPSSVQLFMDITTRSEVCRKIAATFWLACVLSFSLFAKNGSSMLSDNSIVLYNKPIKLQCTPP